MEWFFGVIAEAIAPMERKESTISHAGCILWREDNAQRKYLLVQSLDKTVFVLPKGHVEPGEDPRTTACRELGEETGFPVREEDLKPLKIFAFDKRGTKCWCAYFTARADNQMPPEPGPEARQIRWCSLENVNAMIGENEVPIDIGMVIRATESDTGSGGNHSTPR